MPIIDLVKSAVTQDNAPDALAAVLATARDKASAVARAALAAAIDHAKAVKKNDRDRALAAIMAAAPDAAQAAVAAGLAGRQAILNAALAAAPAAAPAALRAALAAIDPPAPGDPDDAQTAAADALEKAAGATSDKDGAAQAALAVVMGGGSTAAQAPGRSAYLPRYQAPLRRRSDDPGAYRSDRYQSQDDEDLYQDGGDLGPPSSTGTMMELTEAIAGLPAAIFRASVDALTGASSQWDREPPPRRWGSRWRPRSSRRSWYDN